MRCEPHELRSMTEHTSKALCAVGIHSATVRNIALFVVSVRRIANNPSLFKLLSFEYHTLQHFLLKCAILKIGSFSLLRCLPHYVWKTAMFFIITTLLFLHLCKNGARWDVKLNNWFRRLSKKIIEKHRKVWYNLIKSRFHFIFWRIVREKEPAAFRPRRRITKYP